MDNSVELHYPTKEVACTAKLSCISWNPYLRNYLASSDYDGFVTIWDMATAQKVRTFQVKIFLFYYSMKKKILFRNMKNVHGVLIFVHRIQNYLHHVLMIVEVNSKIFSF